MAADTSGGGLNQLENHYNTFIVGLLTPLWRLHPNPHHSQTEKDFAEIAGAGLNFLRIPIAWWAIEVRGDEPFLARTSWTSVFLSSASLFITLTISRQ